MVLNFIERKKLEARDNFYNFVERMQNKIVEIENDIYEKLCSLEKLFKKKVIPSIRKRGLSALVYTEVSDVEDECNGLLTYDRKVIKISVERMRKINEEVKL